MRNLAEICMNAQDPDAPPMDGVFLLRADSVIRFRPPSTTETSKVFFGHMVGPAALVVKHSLAGSSCA